MTIHAILFYLLAAATIASACYVVTSRHPTYGVLSLVVTMFGLSGIFVMLHAYFVAMIQILIYAGAILVLFLYMLMLLGTDGLEPPEKSAFTGRAIPYLLAIGFMCEIAIFSLALPRELSRQAHATGSIEAIGRALFSDYLLPFELVSFILLVGVIGVVYLTKKGAR